MPLVQKNVHPVLTQLRELRKSTGISLKQMEVEHGVNPVVLGSYERGDRNPPLSKLEEMLNIYGHTLRAVPTEDTAIRPDADVIAALRAIADQLEKKRALSEMQK